MQFQHLVDINPPGSAQLTAEQIWRGLVCKAENPRLFIAALDDFRLLDRGRDWLARELRFGTTLIRDRVTFLPPDRMRQEVEAAPMVPGALLEICIESDATGRIGVRFEYRTDRGPADAQYEGIVRQAYVDADTDAIEVIRQMAGAGEL